MSIKAPKGTKDMLPQDAYKWHYIADILSNIAENYGYREIRTPIFEHTELFTRGVGETTDVVQKEMYTFEDKAKRSITLKPEGTAPAVRAFIENALYSETQPTKMYYFTPVFRYENVQKGRLRQHHQFGVEAFGVSGASLDAEIISIAMNAYESFGIKGLRLKINSIGCPVCRKKYNEVLKEFLKENFNELCDTCKTRYSRNPMRILDCKEESCKAITKNAPVILDYICDECKIHFEDLKLHLETVGIKYEIDPYIVRGLDYYSKTVFEIVNDNITVCGGGRYDYLIEQIDGPKMPAVGFGMGMERLLMTLDEEGIEIPKPVIINMYVGSIGEEANLEAYKITHKLRQVGIKAECDHLKRSVKAQMRYANKMGAEYTMILGENELKENKVKIKRMSDGEQFNLELNNIAEIIDTMKNNLQ
ncbi:histidine--tRNA ligase [Clostridium algidicarnis]|uniref:histidine--tRNA ligase n=1 Tax=Clostridium algidicarnis TaxID=37659 RepID=UPI001C0DF2FB|nr:histidine--tRNA ligase [Clostridium algidicarnis]MBU3195736.1 histidine--tRNA ligase [Clostridium algidicarnis]MBU3208758.1 histidine--tRNA ligase [Clostridium algidicarnis]MBU3226731.1 histidine--tRNA ligase [Clostridium algidicarnis]MBU3250358.1 histidine--tRNA ligase [Clostridium algidicarnis]